MKKKTISTLLLFFTLLLCSCGTAVDSSSTTDSPNTESVVPELDEQKENIPPETDISNDDKATNIFSDIDVKQILNQFTEELAVATLSADITNITNTDIENLTGTEDGDITMDAIIDTDTYQLKAKCRYISLIGKWSIESIENIDNNHLYYTPPGTEKYYDIYSFSNDELISPKSAELTNDAVMEDFNNATDKATEDFGSALDELSEKYNQ